MATSTEETVRQEIVDAIVAVAQADLGFDTPDGNIKDYLLEFEPQELWPSYLMASVDGAKEVRAWAVDVRGNDDWFAAGNITSRRYTIRIKGYYAIGVNGSGIKNLITGARKVRGAIRGLGSRLNNRVDIVASTGEIEPDILSGTDDMPGAILVGSITYVAEKRNPDF